MIKEILTQLGSTAVVIAIAGYIFKTWAAHQLDKMTIQNKHQLDLQLELARSVWAKETAKLNVHESYLHKRRVEVIETIYAKMLKAEFSLQNLLVSWWAHSNKEEIAAKGISANIGEFSNKRGMEFCELFTEINAMLHENALYFNENFVDEIISAYKPFFDIILNLDEDNLPKFPDEFKDVVTVGQAPRRSVIALFRVTLGVETSA